MESAPLSSLSWGAGSDGPLPKAGPHSPGTPPTVAHFCEEWTLIQWGYICSLPSPSSAGLIGFSTSEVCTGLGQASSTFIMAEESTGGVLLS